MKHNQRNNRTQQLQLLRIPTGRRQTKWLFTSAAGKLNQGIPGTNSKSGQKDERSQYVNVNGARSKLRQIAIRVPLGSLLGPRLFAIYVNDLPNSSEIGCIHMFADDTTIYNIGKEVEETIDALNHILNDFRVWCCKNHLTVHTGITEAMLISSHAFVGPLRPLMFGNSYIHFTTKSTCLGVEIDYKLNWKPS